MWADQREQLEPGSQGWWGETGQIVEVQWTELSAWVGVESEQHK